MSKHWRTPPTRTARLVSFLNAATALGVCSLALWGTNLPPRAAQALDRLRGWEFAPFAPIVAASALVALNVLVAGRRLLGAENADHLTVAREDGAIRIGVGAIEEPLLRTVQEHPAIEDARVHVFVARRVGRPVKVLASVVVVERPDLPDVIEALRQVVRRRFGELVPVEAPLHIFVKIRRIVPEGERKRHGAGPVTSVPVSSFGAPQYPVDRE
ncbi:MAG: hypothetical protein HY608_08895 [Planctomycetes bacterium]|nr:hypothetical protein [Planctomycetota bacterium]